VIHIIIIQHSVGNDWEGSGGESVEPVSQPVRRGTDKNYENLQASWQRTEFRITRPA